MPGIIRVGEGDSGEHVLVRLARKNIAVVERLLAEIGQQGVPGRVGADPLDDAKVGLRHRLAAASSDGFFGRDGFCGHRKLSEEAKNR